MSDRGDSDKPRLLILASTYPRWHGDTEPGFVHELARRLVDQFDVTVVGPHAPGAATHEVLDGVDVRRYRYAPASMENLVNNGGIATNLRRHPWKWLLVPGFALGLAWSIWCVNRRWRPDVIHAHWLIPQGLAVSLLSALGVKLPPFLVTAHGADLYTLRGESAKAIKRFVVRRAASMTVVSQAMLSELKRIGISTARVAVQPMGVDLQARFTPDESVERADNEILFVGRLVEKKGLRYLLDAMPKVLEELPGAFLTVAGFGPEEACLRAQVQRLGLQDKVDFIGAVPQASLPMFYRRAGVFVAPFVRTSTGDQEGLGLVSVEALGCGCPIVVSDLPVVRDIFHGTEARLVPPCDSGALANAVLESLSQPGSVHKKADRAILQCKFDWASVAARYASILVGLGSPRPQRDSDGA